MAADRKEATLEALGQPPKEIKQTELTYTTRDGHKNRAKLFQPTTKPKDGSPLVRNP